MCHINSTSQKHPSGLCKPIKEPYSGHFNTQIPMKDFPCYSTVSGTACSLMQWRSTPGEKMSMVCHGSFIFPWSWGPTKCQVSSKPRQSICGNITKGCYVNYTEREKNLLTEIEEKQTMTTFNKFLTKLKSPAAEEFTHWEQRSCTELDQIRRHLSCFYFGHKETIGVKS